MNTTKGQRRGVKCGNCSKPGEPVHHKHSAAVRECYARRYREEAEQAELHAQAQAELAAEQAMERYFEEGTPAQQAASWAEAEEERQRLESWL